MSSRRTPKQAEGVRMVPERETQDINFAYVPVGVYHRVCFSLLKDPNALQFVRRADDFVKFVQK